MILRIILLVLGLLPKNLKTAAMYALEITTDLKDWVKGHSNLFTWTDKDEKFVLIMEMLEGKVGTKDMTLKEHLKSLKPVSLNGELANIAGLIVQHIESKYDLTSCKIAFEIVYSKQKNK